MKTHLKIKGVHILIEADAVITTWLAHDYGYYLSESSINNDLYFNLYAHDYDYTQLPSLEAKKYHDDYIVYESKNLRMIDFFQAGISFYDFNKKAINIYARDVDFLYEIFYLSFESLVGEELDKKGWHRLHCLALATLNKATILLLPPGAGKSTLALKFLDHQTIKVLAEDMVIFKDQDLYGLHFRWGTRNELYANQGRLMKRKKHHNKILLDTRQLNLTAQAQPENIMLGVRVSSVVSHIDQVSRYKLIWPLFKSMVLGLELQQSLAYFLLRNYKDVYLKSKIGTGRLQALVRVLIKSKAYLFYMGSDIEKNFEILNDFILKDERT